MQTSTAVVSGRQELTDEHPSQVEGRRSGQVCHSEIRASLRICQAATAAPTLLLMALSLMFHVVNKGSDVMMYGNARQQHQQQQQLKQHSRSESESCYTVVKRTKNRKKTKFSKC